MKIFVSGSCRIVTTINDGRDKVVPIHSMFHNFTGINFLGKLHNTKQQIQFIKFIKDEISIPDYILPQFLTSYKKTSHGVECDDLSLIPMKKANIKNQFDECEWYLFEICSLKLYKNNDYHVQYEHTQQSNFTLQSEEELFEDLKIIRNMIPSNKKILFQVHFRPNVIFDDNNKTIDKREIIYNVVNKFCENAENTFIYDPSFLIKTNHAFIYGDSHFTDEGHIASFNFIYNNYLLK
jgi:hypothetical protein